MLYIRSHQLHPRSLEKLLELLVLPITRQLPSPKDQLISYLVTLPSSS